VTIVVLTTARSTVKELVSQCLLFSEAVSCEQPASRESEKELATLWL